MTAGHWMILKIGQPERNEMSEYIHLMGAEDVQCAGSAMRSAAEEMNRAVSNLEEVIRLHQRFLDDWLLPCKHERTESE